MRLYSVNVLRRPVYNHIVCTFIINRNKIQTMQPSSVKNLSVPLICIVFSLGSRILSNKNWSFDCYFLLLLLGWIEEHHEYGACNTQRKYCTPLIILLFIISQIGDINSVSPVAAYTREAYLWGDQCAQHGMASQSPDEAFNCCSDTSRRTFDMPTHKVFDLYIFSYWHTLSVRHDTTW